MANGPSTRNTCTHPLDPDPTELTSAREDCVAQDHNTTTRAELASCYLLCVGDILKLARRESASIAPDVSLMLHGCITGKQHVRSRLYPRTRVYFTKISLCKQLYLSLTSFVEIPKTNHIRILQKSSFNYSNENIPKTLLAP